MQQCALAKKETELRERENAVSHRETIAGDMMVVLKDRESAQQKREELLLEVERGITACHISIENCIEQEVQEYLKVTLLGGGGGLILVRQ